MNDNVWVVHSVVFYRKRACFTIEMEPRSHALPVPQPAVPGGSCVRPTPRQSLLLMCSLYCEEGGSERRRQSSCRRCDTVNYGECSTPNGKQQLSMFPIVSAAACGSVELFWRLHGQTRCWRRAGRMPMPACSNVFAQLSPAQHRRASITDAQKTWSNRRLSRQQHAHEGTSDGRSARWRMAVSLMAARGRGRGRRQRRRDPVSPSL